MADCLPQPTPPGHWGFLWCRWGWSGQGEPLCLLTRAGDWGVSALTILGVCRVQEFLFSVAPLAHPCGPSTLAASVLAGSPVRL